MKRCGHCKEWKPSEAFGFRRPDSDVLRSSCKLCQRTYSREWYVRAEKTALNERVRGLVRSYRMRNRKLVYAYLVSHPCVDCGIGDPIVLEFDHVRGRKSAAISVLIRNAASLDRIEREIATCVVRCANCHRRRTTRQLQWKSSLFAEGSPVDGA